MNQRPTGIYAALVGFSLAGSLYAHLSGLDPTPIARPVGLLTLGAGCYAAFSTLVRSRRRRGLSALGAVLALGAATEMLGLATGYPFGHYAYTDRWWPVVRLPGVGNYPLQLPFAWALIAGASYLAVQTKPGSLWMAAALATVIDAVMEPTMTRALGYWTWTPPGPMPGGAPILNAAGWFGVTLAAAWTLRAILGTPDNADDTGTDRAPALVLALYCLMVVMLGFIRSI